MPRRILLFTVPSGTPVWTEISRVREAAEEGQADGVALVVGQLLHGCADHVALHGTHDGIGNQGRWIHEGLQPLAIVAVGAREPLAARADEVDGAIADDGRQPGAHRSTLRRIGAGPAPHRQERLLHHVLGPRGVSENPDREGMCEKPVTIVERGKRRLVAAGDAPDERLVARIRRGVHASVLPRGNASNGASCPVFRVCIGSVRTLSPCTAACQGFVPCYHGQTMYTIGETANRSGVSVPLLRAWERRYGVVSPQRTSAGYRLYDDEAVARLRAMRLLVESGWAARQAAAHVADLPAEALADTVAAASGTAQTHEPSGVAAAEELVGRFVDAARQVDPVATERVLDEAYAAASFETATERVVLPALAEVGAAWSRGELDVSAEHAASAAVLRRIGAAFNAAGRAAGAPVVLVGMPAGAHHEIAALAVATAARRVGLDAIYLGPNVPPDSWLSAVAETGARAVVTGAVMRDEMGPAAEALAGLRRAYPELVLAVGGPHADGIASDGIVRLPDPIAQAAESLRRALAGG